MGKFQPGLADSQVPHEQEIEIERPRTATDAPASTESRFDREQPGKDFARRTACFTTEHGVQVVRMRRGLADRKHLF